MANQYLERYRQQQGGGGGDDGSGNSYLTEYRKKRKKEEEERIANAPAEEARKRDEVAKRIIEDEKKKKQEDSDLRKKLAEQTAKKRSLFEAAGDIFEANSPQDQKARLDQGKERLYQDQKKKETELFKQNRATQSTNVLEEAGDVILADTRQDKAKRKLTGQPELYQDQLKKKEETKAKEDQDRFNSLFQEEIKKEPKDIEGAKKRAEERLTKAKGESRGVVGQVLNPFVGGAAKMLGSLPAAVGTMGSQALQDPGGTFKNLMGKATTATNPYSQGIDSYNFVMKALKKDGIDNPFKDGIEKPLAQAGDELDKRGINNVEAIKKYGKELEAGSAQQAKDIQRGVDESRFSSQAREGENSVVTNLSSGASSLAVSVGLGYINPGLASTVIGLGSGADTVRKAREAGLDNEQALDLGAQNMIIQAAVEKVGLDKYLAGASDPIKSFLLRSFVEGTQETTQALIDSGYDSQFKEVDWMDAATKAGIEGLYGAALGGGGDLVIEQANKFRGNLVEQGVDPAAADIITEATVNSITKNQEQEQAIDSTQEISPEDYQKALAENGLPADQSMPAQPQATEEDVINQGLDAEGVPQTGEAAPEVGVEQEIEQKLDAEGVPVAGAANVEQEIEQKLDEAKIPQPGQAEDIKKTEKPAEAKPDTSYQGTGSGELRGTTDYGTRVSDLKPETVANSPKIDAQTAKVIESVRDNPDAEVTVYRAAPENSQINDGDWISLTKEGAERYTKTKLGTPLEGYKVHEVKVKAGEIAPQKTAGKDRVFDFAYIKGKPTQVAEQTRKKGAMKPIAKKAEKTISEIADENPAREADEKQSAFEDAVNKGDRKAAEKILETMPADLKKSLKSVLDVSLPAKKKGAVKKIVKKTKTNLKALAPLDEAIEKQYGKKADKATPKQLAEAIGIYMPGNKLEAGIEVVQKLGKPRYNIDSTRPVLTFGGKLNGVFTDAYIAVIDPKLVGEIHDEIEKKEVKSYIKTLQKDNRDGNATYAELEEQAKKYVQSQFEEYKDQYPKIKPGDEFRKKIRLEEPNGEKAEVVGYFAEGMGSTTLFAAIQSKNTITAVNPDYLALFNKYFPNATYTLLPGDQLSPVQVIDKGKVVGVIMPIRADKTKIPEFGKPKGATPMPSKAGAKSMPGYIADSEFQKTKFKTDVEKIQEYVDGLLGKNAPTIVNQINDFIVTNKAHAYWVNGMINFADATSDRVIDHELAHHMIEMLATPQNRVTIYNRASGISNNSANAFYAWLKAWNFKGAGSVVSSEDIGRWADRHSVSKSERETLLQMFKDMKKEKNPANVMAELEYYRGEMVAEALREHVLNTSGGHGRRTDTMGKLGQSFKAILTRLKLIFGRQSKLRKTFDGIVRDAKKGNTYRVPQNEWYKTEAEASAASGQMAVRGEDNQQSLFDYAEVKQPAQRSNVLGSEIQPSKADKREQLAKTPEQLIEMADQINKAGQKNAILRRGGLRSKQYAGVFQSYKSTRKSDRGKGSGDEVVKLQDKTIENPKAYVSTLAHELSHAIEYNVMGDNKSTLKIFGDTTQAEKVTMFNELKAIVNNLEGKDVAEAKPSYFYMPTEMLARYVETMILEPSMAGELAPTVTEKMEILRIKQPMVNELIEAIEGKIDKGFRNKTPGIFRDLRQTYQKYLGKRVGDAAYDAEIIRRAEVQRAVEQVGKMLKSKFKGVKDKPEVLFRAVESVLVTRDGEPEFGTRDVQVAENEAEVAKLEDAGYEFNRKMYKNGKEVAEFTRLRYTEEQGKTIFESLSPEGQQLVKDFTAAKEEARDEFNREFLKDRYKIEANIEGWVHRGLRAEEKGKMSLGRMGNRQLKGKKAGMSKRRGVSDGYLEDFQKQMEAALVDAEVARIDNEFFKRQLSRISKPIARGAQPDEGWTEVTADLKSGIKLPGEGNTTLIEGDGGSIRVDKPRYQVPSVLAEHYRNIRKVVVEQDNVTKTLKIVSKYWAINVLVHPGTMGTNAISGGIQYAAKVFNDFYLDIFSFDVTMSKTRRNIAAPIQVLLPGGWAKVPDYVFGGHKTNFAGQFEQQGIGNKTVEKYGDNALKLYGTIENYWKKVIAVSNGMDLRTKEGAQSWLAEMDQATKEIIAEVNKDIDLYAFDYDNAPLWLQAWGNKGGAMVKPFMKYPYKYSKMVTNLASGGFDRTIPWEQRMAKVLTLTTMMAIAAALMDDDEKETPEGSDKTPASFDPRGRALVGKDKDGREIFVRTAKYPFFNLTAAAKAIMQGDRDTALDIFNDQVGTVAPLAKIGLTVAGYKDAYSQYKDKGQIIAESLASYIPGFRILKDVGNYMDPVARKPKGAMQAITSQFPIIGDEATKVKYRGERKNDEIPIEPETRSISGKQNERSTYDKAPKVSQEDIMLSFLTGVYLKRIDPKDAKAFKLREERTLVITEVRNLLTEGKEKQATALAKQNNLTIPEGTYGYYERKRKK